MSSYTERLRREAQERAEKEAAAIKHAMGGIPAHIRATVLDPNQVVQVHTKAMAAESGGVVVSIIAIGDNRSVGVARPDDQATTPPDVVKLLLDCALRIVNQLTQPPPAPPSGPQLMRSDMPPGTH